MSAIDDAFTDLANAVASLQAVTERLRALVTDQPAPSRAGDSDVLSTSEIIVVEGVPPLERCCHVCDAVPKQPCSRDRGTPDQHDYPTTLVHRARLTGVPF